MNKIIISLFILVSLICAPFSTMAATSSVKTQAKTTVVKTTKKKSKKKKVARHERLIAVPPLFTLDTAPHSAKPIAKAKKKSSKKSTKKKV